PRPASPLAHPWKAPPVPTTSLSSIAGLSRPFDTFGLSIDYNPDHVVVGVRGELDLLTSPALGAVLRSLCDEGPASVVLDIAELAFLGAAGMGVIAHAALRLHQSGDTLMLRAAAPRIRRILEITGMGENVEIEPEVARGARRFDLTSGLARIRARPASHRITDAALRLVTETAHAAVDGADGVSVTLRRGGEMLTAAATNQTVLTMDAHQYETGEGPCLSAAKEGNWFYSESIEHEDRWPAFTPLAMEQGIASVLSTPLMTLDRPVGALNIYSNRPKAFGHHQQELAELFAAQASGILVDAGEDEAAAVMSVRIADALVSREVIAQAQGVLMARRHLSAEAAAEALHRAARSASKAVQQYASEVVASTDRQGETP
ncbi:MAG: anti-sigma factor antagonist, partial [Actinomycetota bacterium]|nr:anti-sigma factor antagonist [Actinomycetota bacterium]